MYRYKEPVAQQWLSVARKNGFKGTIPLESLDTSIKGVTKDLNEEHPIYGKATLSSPQKWWPLLASRVFRDATGGKKVPTEIGAAIYKHFSSGAAYQLYPDVKPFLQQMHKHRAQLDKGRPRDPMLILGIITNSDPRVRQVLQSMALNVGISTDLVGALTSSEVKEQIQMIRRSHRFRTPSHDMWSLRHDFDFLATSHDEGVEKPGSAIFRHADILASLNVASREERLSQINSQTPTGQVFAGFWRIISSVWATDSMLWIHVGADYEKDYVGAEAFGREAFYLIREGEGQKPVEGAQTISNLIELIPIVNTMVEQNLLASRSYEP